MSALYSATNPVPGLPLGTTDAMVRALRLMRENKYRRRKNVWTAPGGPDIRPDIVAGLKCRNMVTITLGTGADRVEVTKIGELVADMVKAGRRRRAG